MKVLVIGGGGREHALVWRLSTDPEVSAVYAAPGNPGTADLARNVPVAAEDKAGLVAFARKEGIDLTVVGPEDPLAAGVVDDFRAAGLRIFGPTAAAARLEADKAWSKDLMRRCQVPTAEARSFTRFADAEAYIRSRRSQVVVKAAGLAKGKGVVVADDEATAVKAARDMLEGNAFGEAGAKIVVEDRLVGEELSLLAVTDGRAVYLLDACQDHKTVFDGDKGPNTGGMGAYCPAPLPPGLLAEVERSVLIPVLHGMREEGCPYVGVLYAGLMLTRSGPKVLEFNARFGDPETQPIMMRLRTGLAGMLAAAADGTLEERIATHPPKWDPRSAVCVVLASGGYPGDFAKGKAVQGMQRVVQDDTLRVFHSGTTLRDGWVVTNGGRVLGVTALGEGLEAARARAYEAARLIQFDGMHYRTDIGAKGLARGK